MENAPHIDGKPILEEIRVNGLNNISYRNMDELIKDYYERLIKKLIRDIQGLIDKDLTTYEKKISYDCIKNLNLHGKIKNKAKKPKYQIVIKVLSNVRDQIKAGLIFVGWNETVEKKFKQDLSLIGSRRFTTGYSHNSIKDYFKSTDSSEIRKYALETFIPIFITDSVTFNHFKNYIKNTYLDTFETSKTTSKHAEKCLLCFRQIEKCYSITSHDEQIHVKNLVTELINHMISPIQPEVLLVEQEYNFLSSIYIKGIYNEILDKISQYIPLPYFGIPDEFKENILTSLILEYNEYEKNIELSELGKNSFDAVAYYKITSRIMEYLKSYYAWDSNSQAQHIYSLSRLCYEQYGIVLSPVAEIGSRLKLLGSGIYIGDNCKIGNNCKINATGKQFVIDDKIWSIYLDGSVIISDNSTLLGGLCVK